MKKSKKEKDRSVGLSLAVNRARELNAPVNRFPVKPPTLIPGVVPKGITAPVMAMDSYGYGSDVLSFAGMDANFQGFPGYPYLAQLATRAEYRAFASGISTEITREWITVTSSDTAGDSTKNKVTEIAQALEDYGARKLIKDLAEHDSFYGAGQILVVIKDADRSTPLVMDKRAGVKPNSLLGFKIIEPMWTTPAAYNATDPGADDFYRPGMWYMMGNQVHSSRMQRVITRPVPDIFKPAFNFGGLSMSQMAEPTVNNWLRTRQSVADLVNQFSITGIATSMDQVLQGDDDGSDVFKRAELFSLTRSNKGVMMIDKESEEIVQINTPLSTLDMLQAQAQEHMCAVSRQPAVVLTGIEPAGLNTNTEGTLGSWHAWVAAHQDVNYRPIIKWMIELIQLSKYGAIDPEIGFIFNPLDQPTEKELAEIRVANSTAAGNYIDRGVIAPAEERERLARSHESGYQGLQLETEIQLPEVEDEENDD